jgi:hypothetical protein
LITKMEEKKKYLINECNLYTNNKFKKHYDKLIEYMNEIIKAVIAANEMVCIIDEVGNSKSIDSNIIVELDKCKKQLKKSEKKYKKVGLKLNKLYHEVTKSDKSIREEFEHWRNIWISVIKDIADEKIIEEIVNDKTKRKVGKKVFEKINIICKSYMDIVVGNKKIKELEILNYGRLLENINKNSVNAANKQKIVRLLNETFYLGIISMLFITKYPTRENVGNVDIKSVYNNWIINSICASEVLGKCDELIYKIYQKYFNDNVHEFLSKELNIKNIGMHISFFEELYLAGILLIINFDKATKK